MTPFRSCFLALAVVLGLFHSSSGEKVAIIGGGVSGSFAAKYLVDYDTKCTLASIVIFDPSDIGQETPLDNEAANSQFEKDDESEYWQGGRVASVRLADGNLIELGASIAFEGFKLVDQIVQDGKLTKGKPFSTGKEEDAANNEKGLQTGLGIYDGDGRWPLLTSRTPGFLNTLNLLYRYNVDLWRVRKAAKQAERCFYGIHKLLESIQSSTFFESPHEMWEAVGLLEPLQVSYDDFLDVIGLPRELPWWRKLLPFQGCLRSELLTAINLCNYNQGNSQLNGLVGLGSFLAEGELFSIVGGNYQIVESALEQARTNRETQCPTSGGASSVQHVQQKVTTVVGSLDGLQLYSNEEHLGQFDVVILAAPLQHARIEFLIRSHLDEAVVQPMPLNGMVDPDETSADDGFIVLPKPLPPSAVRRYTQVVTTIVSNATLRADHFYLNSTKSLPRSILVTENGKAAEKDINSVTQITVDGVYKIFSNGRLDKETLDALFGPYHAVDYVKRWGGPHGGATPTYNGEGTTMDYLLYDSGLGLQGHTKSGALYYANAIEASFACMELSAIGAKSVAKLVARRLELVVPQEPKYASEEL